MTQVTATPDVYEEIGADLFGSVGLVVLSIAEKRGAGMILRARQTEALS